jgi:hypothetical protein
MLRSPTQPETPDPILLLAGTPLAQAMPMADQIPTTVTVHTNSFIDDLIWVFLDRPDNRVREPHTVPLAIHVTSQPHMGEAKPVQQHQGLLSAPKLKVEGTQPRCK